MIFFDPNRQKVTAIAKEALEQVNQSGESPDLVIEKLCDNYGLNANWRQRIVEEYNIQAFLQKLQEGTQHEHYQVAQPVIDECKQWLGIEWYEPIPENNSNEGIKKTASYGDAGVVPLNAFEYDVNEEFKPFDPLYVSGDNFDDTIELEKVAFEKQQMLQEMQKEELQKEASYYIQQAEDKILGELIKIANISPGFAKSIIHDLSKTASRVYAEDVLIGCKHKPEEILEASIYDDVAPYEFEKLASVKGLIEELSYLIPLKKGVAAGKEKFIAMARKLKSDPVRGIIIPAVIIKNLYKEITESPSKEIGLNIKAFADQ